jgi:DNA-binding transcriptional ArsR family regulator
MDDLLHALAAPNRRAILELLRRGEMSAGDIARQFPVTRPAISQHLTVLRLAGLIEERRSGTRRLYRARPEGTSPLRAWLNAFWDDRLADLKDAIEEEHRGSSHRAS